eukprot:6462329-Amphidinium_carterae.2
MTQGCATQQHIVFPSQDGMNLSLVTCESLNRLEACDFCRPEFQRLAEQLETQTFHIQAHKFDMGNKCGRNGAMLHPGGRINPFPFAVSA